MFPCMVRKRTFSDAARRRCAPSSDSAFWQNVPTGAGCMLLANLSARTLCTRGVSVSSFCPQRVCMRLERAVRVSVICSCARARQVSRTCAACSTLVSQLLGTLAISQHRRRGRISVHCLHVICKACAFARCTRRAVRCAACCRCEMLLSRQGGTGQRSARMPLFAQKSC